MNVSVNVNMRGIEKNNIETKHAASFDHSMSMLKAKVNSVNRDMQVEISRQRARNDAARESSIPQQQTVASQHSPTNMVEKQQSYYENTIYENNVGSQMGSVEFNTARSLFDGCENGTRKLGAIPASRGQIDNHRTNPLQVPPMNRSNMTSHMSRTKVLDTDPSSAKYKAAVGNTVI